MAKLKNTKIWGTLEVTQALILSSDISGSGDLYISGTTYMATAFASDAFRAPSINTNAIYKYTTNDSLWVNPSDYNTGGNGKLAVILGSGNFTQSSGDNGILAITPTYNQTGDAANTDFLINRIETAVGSGAQNLIDAQVGSVSKFYVNNTGGVFAQNLTSFAGISAYANYITGGGGGFTLYGGGGNPAYMFTMKHNNNVPEFTQTTGYIRGVEILPVYNQASGDAANTDLLINRTVSAIGSGAQILIDAQVDSVSQFSISSDGTAKAKNFTGKDSSNVDSFEIVFNEGSETIDFNILV